MQRRNERFVERLPLVLDRPWRAYAFTTFFCLAAFALRLAAEAILPIGYPFVSFFPAVILSSFLFGIRPGIYAAILCGLLSWYFFMPPRFVLALNPAVIIALCFYATVVTVDIVLIHFMQRANFNLAVERERSRALADNREVLFSELQHRVSNNLQVVAALLSLQRRHIDHDLARKALDDASARLALIGRISRALYRPGGSGPSIKTFLATLSADLMEASGRTDIALSIDAPANLTLDPEMAVPFALIVAECLSNAIEHGFATRGGTIAVILESAGDGALSLCVVDDGDGLPPAFEATEGSSLGLRIATTLAAQLGGSFLLEHGAQGGAVARLDLPQQSR